MREKIAIIIIIKVLTIQQLFWHYRFLSYLYLGRPTKCLFFPEIGWFSWEDEFLAWWIQRHATFIISETVWYWMNDFIVISCTNYNSRFQGQKLSMKDHFSLLLLNLTKKKVSNVKVWTLLIHKLCRFDELMLL